jgi:hypothetical protein
MWTAVLVASVGCAALKLAGWSLPPRWLEGELLQRAAVLLPVALLAALVAVQTLGDEGSLVLDARIAGVVVAAVLLALRAPFLVVILAAAVTAAGLRALT